MPGGIVHAHRHPTDAWVAQQLREATPFGERPQFLIRDNDRIFGACFDRIAAASGIRVLRTPLRALRANVTCERFLGSVRRECFGPPARARRSASAAHAPRVCRLLQPRPLPSGDRPDHPCGTRCRRPAQCGHRAGDRLPDLGRPTPRLSSGRVTVPPNRTRADERSSRHRAFSIFSAGKGLRAVVAVREPCARLKVTGVLIQPFGLEACHYPPLCEVGCYPLAIVARNA